MNGSTLKKYNFHTIVALSFVLALGLAGTSWGGQGNQGNGNKGSKYSLDMLNHCEVVETIENGTVFRVTTMVWDTSDDWDTSGDAAQGFTLDSYTVSAYARLRGKERYPLGSGTYPLRVSVYPSYTYSTFKDYDLCQEDGSSILDPDARSLNADVTIMLDGKVFASSCDNLPPDDPYAEDTLDESNIDLDLYDVICPPVTEPTMTEPVTTETTMSIDTTTTTESTTDTTTTTDATSTTSTGS